MTGLQICQMQLREVQKIWQLAKNEEELTKAISEQLVQEAKQKEVQVKKAKEQLLQQKQQQQELTEEEQQQLKVIIYKTS